MRPWLALDLETSGVLPEYALQPWRVGQRKAWITTVAFARRNKADQIVTDGTIYPKRSYLREILQRAIDTGMRIVVWNGTFDIAWLCAYGCGDLVDKCLWFDGMLAWKHLDLTPSFATNLHTYKLKGEHGAVGAFCPEMIGYEDEVDYHDPSPENLAKLLAYDKNDTAATLISSEKIWEQLKGSKRGATVLTEAECLPMVAKANLYGMRINRPAVKALNAKLNEVATKMAEILEPLGVNETVIRSPKQLSAVIFDSWGLPQIQGRSTKRDVLSELVILDDRVALLMQYREALGLQSKFIGGIVKSCEYNEDRISRPQCVVFGTYTSRCTYSSIQGKKGTKAQRQVGFALHQMKRAKDFRDLVLAPEEDEIAPEGYDIVEFDAAGQEFRFMAIVSNDEVMLNLCLPGEDPHAYMAAAIYSGDYRGISTGAKVSGSREHKQRQGGKVTNLSLQYRTSAKTLRIRARTDHGLILSENESNRIHRTYPRTYPGVPKYWDRQIQLGRRLGYAETLAGRRVSVKGNWLGPHQWSMESTMINYPVQGTGGDQKYLAMRVLKNRLADYDARFAWDLHDGIYFYVPRRKSMKFAVEQREVLDHLPYEKAWGFSSPIPLTWDCKIGPSWGSLKPVED